MDHHLKLLIAPDSFKESLTALEAAEAIEKGFKKEFPNASYTKIPMADGGEGTVQSIVDATRGKRVELEVTGPLGNQVKAFYGLSGDESLAIIEMASSSGLELVKNEDRNPLYTTSWGFGELIKDALDHNVEEILLGIGGSASNDGGAGMIQALGGKLLNQESEQIEPTGRGLADLKTIDLSTLDSRISEVTFRTACDVDNPLTGSRGASYIYGPQKGATDEQVKYLDQNLKHYARQIKQYSGTDVEFIEGLGAAGGLGAGLLFALDSELQRGGELLAEILQLEEEIKKSDLVITGEGGINEQTVYGKTPVAVSMLAEKYNIPVICLAGTIDEGFESVYEYGITAVFSILPELSSLEETLKNGESNLMQTAENIAKIIKLSKKHSGY